jgi:tRNA threonylcarbamoyladenosine biosynthesis protein TsaB
VNILAFDTSTTACSVALLNTELTKVAPMQQGNLILPMIQQVLSEASLTIQDLDAIAYGCGPGSFTGIRIASSVAQGIGFAANCPIIPISSMAAMAQAAYLAHQWEHLLVGLDARMGQVYWAQYNIKQGQAELIGHEEVCAPTALNVPNNTGWYGVGDAWNVYADSLTSQYAPLAINPNELPTAKAILMLANSQFAAGHWVSASEALPIYLR